MIRIDDVINVFYSSTNDHSVFDRKLAFDRTCGRVEIGKSVKVNVIYWKDSIASGIGKTSGQDVIDSVIEGQYDVYFGCLGASTGKGTVREYKNAIDGYLTKFNPQHLIFGFDETPVNPFSIDDTFNAVKKFRKDIAENTKYGAAMLYFTFSSEREFEEQVFLNLCRVADKIHSRVLGGTKIA